MSLTMAMLPQHASTFSPNGTKGGGILLNSHHSRHRASSHIPPSSPSSTDSASQSASEDSSKGKSPSRRITFAPLPKPRAHSNPDGETTPIIVVDHDGDRVPYDHIGSASSLSGDDTSVDPATYAPPRLDAKKTSSWSNSTKKLLRPFYQPLVKADPDSGSGGALGLFRSSSRESTASSAGTLTDSGHPIKRRMSTGSAPYNLGAGNHLQPNNAHLALTPVASENGGVAAGTRMLNGRIYGSSRVRQPKRDHPAEPEFVEWGYGGMGSNSGSSASSAYAKVQSSHKNVVAAEDDDDGSGMGWVRRRREAREREKKEREQREQVGVAEEQPIETTAQAPAADTDVNPVEDASHSEHFTVNIPVRPRPRPHDRHGSGVISGSNTPPMTSTHSNDSTHTITPASHPAGHTASGLRNETNLEESSESSSEDDTDENSGSTEKDDDDDEEEIIDEVTIRKTSQCAGVEKISRHKD